MSCEHPWGFDIQDRCCYGCGHVLTQDEIDAFEREEAQIELMKSVPEMQLDCQPLYIEGTGEVGVACSLRGEE